jgi:hypothetical protein
MQRSVQILALLFCSVAGCFAGVQPQQITMYPNDVAKFREPGQKNPIEILGDVKAVPNGVLWVVTADHRRSVPLLASDVLVGEQGICVTAPGSPWNDVTSIVVSSIDPQLVDVIAPAAQDQSTLQWTELGQGTWMVAGESTAVRSWFVNHYIRAQPAYRSRLGLPNLTYQLRTNHMLSESRTWFATKERLFQSSQLVGWRWSNVAGIATFDPAANTQNSVDMPKHQIDAWQRKWAGNKAAAPEPCPLANPSPLFASE